MADEIDVSLASYEELMDLERDFESAELEILRQQIPLLKPLYEKRTSVIAKIPNFWALVFEQAPPDLDQFIQPSDSAVLLSSLTSISVSHFDVENGGKGDPRNVAVTMEFAENEWFEDKVLVKKFWHRQSKGGDAGLVSEPVAIKWKAADKDLTQGMLDLAIKVWENDKKQGPSDSAKVKKEKDYNADEKALKAKIEATGRGGVSFFAWFGFRGLNVSEEESRLAIEKDKKIRAEREAGNAPDLLEALEEEDDDDEDDDEDPFGLEIFPEGDEVAIEITEDLWPNAIKYFTQAQEVDVSDMDFEEEDEDEEMDDDEEKPKTNGAEPPSKKRKA